jgi:acetylornithine deacetylase/succinyl-diaminopimelate desuccinylase-like protein
VLDDPKITVRYMADSGVIPEVVPDRMAMPPPPLRDDVMGALRKTTGEMWPGIPVLPDMAIGASDDVYVTEAGIPAYDVSGDVTDRGDDRSHGDNERTRVSSFYGSVDFYYRFVKQLTGK